MPNILKVRTLTQKEVFVKELQGQISDGMWENDNTDSRLWSCDVVVASDDDALGCNFKPLFPINFAELEYVLDRAVEIGKTVDPDYSMDKLMEDLVELTEIVWFATA